MANSRTVLFEGPWTSENPFAKVTQAVEVVREYAKTS